MQRVMDLRLARASKLVLCVPRAVMVFFLLRFQLSFANDIQVLFQRVGTCADVKHFVLGQFEIRYDFIAVDSILECSVRVLELQPCPLGKLARDAPSSILQRTRRGFQRRDLGLQKRTKARSAPQRPVPHIACLSLVTKLRSRRLQEMPACRVSFFWSVGESRWNLPLPEWIASAGHRFGRAAGVFRSQSDAAHQRRARFAHVAVTFV